MIALQYLNFADSFSDVPNMDRLLTLASKLAWCAKYPHLSFTSLHAADCLAASIFAMSQLTNVCHVKIKVVQIQDFAVYIVPGAD